MPKKRKKITKTGRLKRIRTPKEISLREWRKALNESLKENDELMRILAKL